MFAKFGWASLAFQPILNEITNFCASEPAQPAPLTDATLLAAFRNPIAFENVLAYLKESAIWWVWSNNCQCNASPGGTCTWAVTATSVNDLGDPSRNANYQLRWVQGQTATLYGARVYNATGFSTPKTVSLWDSTGGLIHSEQIAAVAGWQDMLLATPQALTNGAHYAIQFNTAAHEHYIDTGQANGPGTDTNGSPYSAYFEDYTSNPLLYNGAVTRSYPAPLGPIICVGGPPAGAPYAPAQPAVPTITVPDVPLQTSCTTQDLCDSLNRLLAMEVQTRQMVDLIQRQEVPFAYLIGTVHSGLSGSGSISVQGILGLLVQVSTVPAGWGQSADNPQRYIPAPAEVSVGDSAGLQDTHFAHFTEELVFPRYMGTATVVEYQFKPGCGGAITELVREP